MRALTAEDIATVDAITYGQHTNLVPMTAELDGRDVVLIVAINIDDDVNEDGNPYVITPVAVLVDDEIMSRLNPGDDVTSYPRGDAASFDAAVTAVEHDHDDDGGDD